MMILRLLPLIVAISCSVSMAYAEFTLVPGVDLSVEYDDNVNLEADNEQDDLITTLSPNLSMSWATPQLDVSMFASVTMEKYLDRTENDRIGAGESKQASSLTALAKLYKELLFLRLSDSYSRVPIDEGGPGGEGNRLINLTDSNNFQINPYLQLQPLKDTQLRLGYTYTDLWYEEDQADNSTSHLYSASLSRELSARFSTTLSGSYQQFRPETPLYVVTLGSGGAYRYDNKSASIGLSYQASERLTLNGQYGHSWLDYDVRADSDSQTWSAMVDYEITSSYSVGAGYSRDYAVSVDEGPSESKDSTAYLKYSDRYTLMFSLFSRSNDYVEIDRGDDSYGGSISGELPFNDKVGLTGMLRYANFDRSGSAADQYDRYSTRFSLYYETRLGRINAGHTFTRNDGSLSVNNYTNNTFFINASLRF